MQRVQALLVLALLAGSVQACQEKQSVPVPRYGPASAAPKASCIQEAVELSPSSQNPKKELSLSDAARQQLLLYARHVCNGDRAVAEGMELPGELAEIKTPVLVMTFDVDGSRNGYKRMDDPNTSLPDKVAEAIAPMCSRRSDLWIHLAVVSYTARMPNFGIKGLFDNKVFEPQVTGVAYEKDGRRVEMDPILATMQNMGSKTIRSRLARKMGFDPKRMTRQNDLTIEFYRVIHFGETYPDRNFADFHRGNRVFRPEELNREVLEQRLRLIGEWYKHNVRDGQVIYEYSPYRQRTYDKKRTMVRSTMSTWILNRLAFYLKDDELKRLGNVTIDYYLDRYFNIERSRKKGAIVPSEKPLANGNLARNRYTTASFIASAILEREDHARWGKDPEMLMDWAMGFMRDDGVMWTQFAQSQYFMPGQLLLAVSYFYDATRDEKYLRFFNKAFDAYSQPLYDMMHLGQGRYIPYAPAWYTQPLANMYRVTKDAKFRDLVYEINDRVVRLYLHNAREQVYYDYDGCLNPKLGFYGNNSITAAALESLVDAAAVAKEDGDERRLKEYKKVIRHTVAFLLRLQYTPENTYYIRDRQQVIGGFRKDMLNTVVWMDNVWHLTSAFMKVQEHHLLD